MSNLKFEITGNASGLTTALTHAKANLDKFAGQAGGIFKNVGSMGGMVGKLGVAGGAGAVMHEVIASTQEYLDKIKELKGLSKTTGMSVSDLSALAAGARITGVSIDSLGTAIRMMQKNLGRPLNY